MSKNKWSFSLHQAPANTKLEYVEGIISPKKLLRSPIVDGLFYPEEKAGVLAFMKDIGLEKGKGGRAQAIIAPHGAWEISGSLAGAAFASAGGRSGRKCPSRVVIMGPIHDSHEKGIFLTNSHDFQTPLGTIPVDQEAVKWLESYNALFEVNDIPHLHEHSIEVLLPFVKYCFPQAALVPILVGNPGVQCIGILARALRAIFEPIMRDTLFIISFNMAVYSGDKASAAMAAAMAEECMRLFREGCRDELLCALQEGRITGCGSELITALLQSGLLDSQRPRLASDSLLSAQGEKGKMVYYGAFSFGC